MAGLLPGDFSHHGSHRVNSYKHSQEKLEDGGRWYFTRKEIEETSPSKRDGVDLKKETYLRKSYCTFLQDLGMRLKVPQVTIATAIIFCHRFFLRQSHAKNDRRTIATVCMFLAGKVEETPRPLKDVILVSYEIINKKDPAAVQRIKQKEVYEQQKELVLLGERVVLGTLGFDLNLHHPYKPLVEAIKKFKVAQNALAQVAWNFVNDGLRTSLCLQFKPHHIAAGAIFLAAKFLKVKLPSDGEKVWWQEFDVTPRQLEEVSNQMLELYEQNRVPPSNDAEGSAGGSTSQRGGSKGLTCNDENATTNSQVGGTITKPESRGLSSMPVLDATRAQSGQTESQESVAKSESLELDKRDRHSGQNQDCREGALYRPPADAIKKIDRDKVKAALEKRKKASSHMTRKAESMNEDDLIERELEAGIELAAESERNKQDRRPSWSSSSNKHENDEGTKKNQLLKGQSSHVADLLTVEEGEVSVLDDNELGNQSSKLISRKRKALSSPEEAIDGKYHHSNVPGSQHCHRPDYMEDRNKVGRLGHTERDS